MTNNPSTLPSREKLLQYTNEATILKPASVNVHTDEWPCFVLKEAVVRRVNCKALANLLDAELDGPLVVHGQLHLDKGQKRNVISPYSKGQLVEISDVREFSFDDTGSIWAKGIAGWFEVQPAPPYMEIYETMVAGVDLFFFATDLHIEQTGKKRNGSVVKLDVPSIVDSYIKRKSPLSSPEEVTELLKNNGGFLLSMMRKPHAQVQWKRSNLYNWLVQELPDVYSKFNNLHAKLNSKTSNGNSRVTKSRPSESNEKTTVSSVASVIIVQTMEEMHTTGRCLRPAMTVSRVGKALYEDYDLESVFVAQELVGAHARAIVSQLSDEWSSSPIYVKLTSLQSSPQKSKSEQKELLRITLRPRDIEVEVGLENMDISADDPKEDSHLRPRNRRQKGGICEGSEIHGYPYEQSDTPTNSKPIESETGRVAGKRMTRNDDVVGSVTSTPVGRMETRATRSGKVAALRLKRPIPLEDQEGGSSVNTNTDEPPRKIQRTRRSQAIRDNIGHTIDSEESTSESEEEFEEDYEEHEAEEETNELMLVEERLPTLESEGPDGQWICPKPECGYLIHNADEDESQGLIKEHYEEHAACTQEQLNRINLVKQESRPHLSVSHLLEKLQRLGEDELIKKKEEINGKVVQPRIKQKSMV